MSGPNLARAATRQAPETVKPADPPPEALEEKTPPEQDQTPPEPPETVGWYEIKGKRYYLFASARSYTAEGEASWYGRRFHGRKTASGEVYDMNKLTAAHRNLPFNTWLKVYNLDNGRQVLVRVTDRGPFDEKERLIDLSRAAAKALGMIRSGKARVRVEALGLDGDLPIFQGKVIHVSQGDNISVLNGKKAVEVRLAGIDCPETDQPWGKQARELTSRLVLHKKVTVRGYRFNRFGMTVADVQLPDGRLLNRELLRAGLAWWFQEDQPPDPVMPRLHLEALYEKRGLWASSSSPVPPWEWRRARNTEDAPPGPPRD